jgi:hypothetical protein
MRMLYLTAGSVAVMLALGGCAGEWTPPLTLAQGYDFCIPNPESKTAIVGIDVHNTSGQPITITGAYVEGQSELRNSKAWLVRSLDGSRVLAAQAGIAPFTSVAGWADRLPVGKAVLGAGKYANVAVSMTFPAGYTRGSSASGIGVNYRMQDGTRFTGSSNVTATIVFAKDGC